MLRGTAESATFSFEGALLSHPAIAKDRENCRYRQNCPWSHSLHLFLFERLLHVSWFLAGLYWGTRLLPGSGVFRARFAPG